MCPISFLSFFHFQKPKFNQIISHVTDAKVIDNKNLERDGRTS